MSEELPTGLIYAFSEQDLPEPVPTADHFSIKIGYTSGGTAGSRLKSCQTGNPRQLRIIAEFRGRPDDESKVHRVLSQFRQVGEWFRLPGFLVDELFDPEIQTAKGLLARFRDLGCREPGVDGVDHKQGETYLQAWQAIKQAHNQSYLAERLLEELECLDDTGALTVDMLVDALASAGFNLVQGPESINYLLTSLRSEVA